LAERLLPTPEIRRSNPEIGKIFSIIYPSLKLFRKDETKLKKAQGIARLFLKKSYH